MVVNRGQRGDDILEAAIVQLGNVVNDGEIEWDIRVQAKCCLIKAYLSRFACHGWVEDLDLCWDILRDTDKAELSFLHQHWINGGCEILSEEIQSASALIVEYRQSVNVMDYT
ncbi:hypothetical protein CC1G_12155 [Coprinopsis cinerea okayama7|uniref:Uncharacterized protein n=1 Tax=Coprinopsis cinerea (strain Okayama-7 / 130 / ATCC MYA-4618 / FGSC 9003) TaxID=240176 RepID=A8N0B7_COPC7|nr:hypothetical protein CC1G_12155 [Coprinopsis cinerea okayama7\|eukprot:XP_001828314.1 hypothetical protein CC1G_12155 [Coprinopsis cinerea okayama7\